MTPEELQELEEKSKGMGAEGISAALELERYQKAQATPTEQEEAQAAATAATVDTRPATAFQTENPIGNIAVDGTKIAANAFVGFGTDILDLAAGIGDTAVQTANVLQGKDWDWDAWMNDSDNGWTQWRRETFKTSTKLGQTVSNFVRLGTLLATLPKAGASLAARGAKAAAGVSKASRLSGAADAFGDAATASRNANLTQQIQKLAKGTASGGDAKKALDIAGNTPEISTALKGVVQNSMVQGPGVASYSQKVGQRLKNVGLSIVDRYRPRNLAETLGYDALATFMVSGEGVLDFDETVSDFAMEMGLPYYSGFTTSAEDSAFAIKMKQVAEGLPISAAMQPLIDMWTIGRFAKRIKNADPKLKEALLEEFGKSSNELGVSVAKVYTGQYAQGIRLGADAVAGGGAGNVDQASSQLADAVPFRPKFEGRPDQYDPFSGGGQMVPYQAQPGGALARLADDSDQARALQDAELTEMVPPASDRFLRKNDPFVDDELATTPGSQYTGGTDLGIQEADVIVEPGTGMRPRLPGTEDAPALEAGIEPVDVRVLPDEGFGATTRTGQPGAQRPELEAGIDPVAVRVLNTEAIVTPQTIRAGFEQDMAAAFRQSIELQQDEVAPGVFESLKSPIKRLMPSTRLDALDYLNKNSPAVNASGVLSASDSVWTNFIINRGRKEGWIKIDENFNFTTNREIARGLDRGSSAEQAARNVDEAVQLEELEATTGVDTQLGQIEANRAAGVEVVKAADTMQREAARVAPKAPGSEADRELIQEVLGVDVDDVVDLYIEKAPQGRKHQVVRSDGTVVGQFTRKSQAEKFVQQEAKKITDDLTRKAKQAQADAIDQRIDIGDVVKQGGTDEPLSGRITFTKVQKDVLAQFSDELGALLNADPKKKTYDFDYYEMAEFMDGLRYMVDSGEFKGNKLRVLRNLLNKIETVKTELDPIAQARAKADELSRLAQRESDHNDYCF